MNKFNFPLWLEQRESRPIVFCDMDETICHTMEIGWLKDSSKNKKFAKIVASGKHPHKDVKQIHVDDKDLYVFPRPGVIDFLKSINKFADFIILSHNTHEYLEIIVKIMGWSKYINDYYSTRDTKPSELSKKFDLKDRDWVLVDNLPIRSIEVINKLRILGLGCDSSDPEEVVKHILSEGEKHFVKAKDWIPTVEDYDDFDLWNILPHIKKNFGIDFVDFTS
jgi:hypothetical protein